MPITRRSVLVSTLAAAVVPPLVTRVTGQPGPLRILGVGGGGMNALAAAGPVLGRFGELTAINTDRQDLVRTPIRHTLRIGRASTQGLGAGSDLEVGRGSALEQRNELRALVSGARAVLLLGGLGGGTATGALPVLAEVCREAGARALAVVTLPFYFEGRRRRAQAAAGVEALVQAADQVVLVRNDEVRPRSGERRSLREAFGAVDAAVTEIADATRIGWMLAEQGALSAEGRSMLLRAGTGTAGGPVQAVLRALEIAVRDGSGRAGDVLVHLRGLAPSEHDAAQIETLVSQNLGRRRVVLATTPGAEPTTATVLVPGGSHEAGTA